MNNINSLSFDTQNILNELQILIPQFNKFFNINDIFSSEIGGKTRLHRQIFNENNESIQESISRLNIQFDDFLSLIRQEMRNILAKYGEFDF
jgi:prephenate dehydrogenase